MMQRESSEGVAARPTAPLTLEDTSENRELVLAFKRGEDGAYQAIYDRYSTRVSGICRRMLEQSHDAEEAQQEIFMRVYTALPNFNGRYQLGAWVSRIATNVCLDHIRSKGRKPADSTDFATLVDVSDDSADGPEEIFMKGDERQRVREVLTDLAPMHRAALALREFEGMSYADIAVALGMTEPQVKALIHRARRSFKKRWAHGLALLLPWRLLARIRRFSNHYDAPPQLADAAASTSNFAATCSAALHQCGAILTDKAAGAFTALVVGAAAVGAAVVPGSAPVPQEKETQHERPVADLGERVNAKKSVKTKKVDKRKAPVIAAAPAPADDPEPVPAEDPEPAPEERADESSEPAPSGGGESTSTPPPTATYFGFDRGQPIPKAEARSSMTKLNCVARTLRHDVDTFISEGAFSYRMVMTLEATATRVWFQFTVYKNNDEVRYSTWGPEPAFAWSNEGAHTQLEISGEYGALPGYDAEGANLPHSGTYDATLTLDCGAQGVISEGAVFTAQ